MDKNELNICQVSLNRDIALIEENLTNFKKIYKKDLKLFVVCPETQINEFKKRLNFSEVEIINENELISFNDFKKIFNDHKHLIVYEDEFSKRLSWYYQQVLKITFSLNFISKNKKNLIIWDADTVILKKINFFKNDLSIKYGNFFEFHKAYYLTNEQILKKIPSYFISFLNQFIAISEIECAYFATNNLNSKLPDEELGKKISEMIIKSIFIKHKNYNGSMFSEYELIGHSNYTLKNNRQRPLLYLRFGLDGKLTRIQKRISILLGYKHVTYEHSHPNIKSLGMLNRKQSWRGFLTIILKNFFKFYLRYLRHIILYRLDKKNR